MLKFAKFIGANTDFSTAQAYLFPRVLPEDSQEPVFGLVVSGDGEDVFIYVRQKVLNLEERFNAPFERVTEKLHELGEAIKLEFTKVENLKFSLFCAKEGTFYVYQHGDNYIQLLRDGKLEPVLQDATLQEKVISGFIKSGDRIVVLSAKPGERNWSNDVLEQIIGLPLSETDDAEAIFAQNELKIEQKDDFAGVKNITPTAFILIENLASVEGSGGKEDSGIQIPKPRIDFKVKIPSFNPWVYLHRVIRRLFGVLRVINRKVLIGLIAFILILALAGGGYLFWQSRNSSQNTRLNNLITAIEGNLNEATGLKDSDPKAAAEKINQAKARLSEAEGLDKDNSIVSVLKERVDEKEAEVLRIYRNFNLDLFMSLDLINDNFKTERMSFSVGKLLLLDPNQKSLVAIDAELKTPSILAGPQQLGAAKLASLNGSHAFTYSPDKGIVHVDIDNKRATNVASADPDWGNVEDLFGFSGNVYALDTNKNMIWKYAPTQSGYSEKQEYLRSETNLGLGKRLIIDYSVWVLTSEPDILKFTAGNEDYFALSGLNDPLTQIDGLFVPEEQDLVLILDKSTNRILVTKKNGEYLAQYINPEFSKISDFFVDEEQKLIYLLIENKIYTTPLR